MCKVLDYRLYHRYVIPHPEQKPDYVGPIITVDELITDCYEEYDIPTMFMANNVDVEIHPFNGAGLTWMSLMKILISPPYANAGVLGHEYAHIEYGLLPSNLKEKFNTTITPLIRRNIRIKTMLEQYDYGFTNRIELHAEIFRYLGDEMPAELYRFYPNLIMQGGENGN